MRSLLIIGAGRLQVPAYVVGRKLGLRLVGVDRDPGAPGMPLSDVPCLLDTRDVDGIVALARRERVAAAMTLCTDAPVVAVAAVGQALGLQTISPVAALKATNKARMREALAAASVPIPRFEEVASLEEARSALRRIGLPAILKPPASSGSRGICQVRTPDTLEAAFSYTSATASGAPLLLEEFIDGPEVSVETLSFGGRHHIIQITDKRTSGAPNWVEIGHVQPSRLPDLVQRAIADLARASLNALGVDSSAGHVEIKIGSEGPKLIEVGARLGGDFITTELAWRSTGIDMVEAAIRMALGEHPRLARTRSAGAAIRYMVAPPGRVHAISGEPEARAAQGVVRLEIDCRRGEAIHPVHSSLDRAGFVVCEGATPEEAERLADDAMARIRLEMEPE